MATQVARSPAGAAQGGNAAQLPGQHPLRGAGRGHHELLFAAGVAGAHEGAAIGQPLQEAAAARPPLPLHRALPQRHREGLAAHLQRQAVALRVQRRALQVVGSGHEAARGLRARARHLDLDVAGRLRPGHRRVQQPQLTARGVGDALAVAGRVAHVPVGVLRVALQVAAVGRAAVDVGHAVGVVDEEHAVAEPHGAAHVARQLGHAAEAAAGFVLDPQLPHTAAAVALPARRIAGVAADEAAAARAEGKVVDGAQRHTLGQATFEPDREGLPVAEEGLAVVAGEHDAALGREATHREVAAQPGEAPRRAAGRGHEPDLAVLLVAAGEGEPAAAGRELRRARLRQAGGQPLRGAAGGGDTPEVVVADEDEGVAMQRGLAQVGRWQGLRLHRAMIARAPGAAAGLHPPEGGCPSAEGWVPPEVRPIMRARSSCQEADDAIR
jgi:hypothetical protein